MTRYLLSPMVLISAVWLFATLLYFLRWSVQFVFDPAEVLPFVGIILGSFGIGCGLAYFYHHAAGKNAGSEKAKEEVTEESIQGCWTKTISLFRFWLILAGAQIIAMGGFPLLWLLIGDDRSYRDFGFLSLNGLINSLILACAMSGVFYWLTTNKKRYLWLAGLSAIYSILIFNRQMLFTLGFEVIVLYLIQRPVGIKVVARLLIPVVLLVVVNGIIGNYRTGDEELKELFQVRYEYSQYPGSVLWLYAYVTTPLNNLINTIYTMDPSYNPLFFNTVSYLFPSVLRVEIFSNVQLLSANLYSGAFTVSTAFVDPYLDYGMAGMAIYGVLFGFIAQLTWFYPTPRSRLMYCVLAQSALLSIFTNFLFYLPSIFQLFWIYLIGSKYQATKIDQSSTDPSTAEDSSSLSAASDSSAQAVKNPI